MMVTVICLAYNHGPYIRDALEGFVMQKTAFPFEVIVHDDASTDDTPRIIREYHQTDGRILHSGGDRSLRNNAFARFRQSAEIFRGG